MSLNPLFACAFPLLVTILLVSLSLAQADIPDTLEVRFIDVPMTSASSTCDTSILPKAFNKAPADTYTELVVSGTQDIEAEVSGVIEWLMTTKYDPAEVSKHDEIEGEITRGGYAHIYATQTASSRRAMPSPVLKPLPMTQVSSAEEWLSQFGAESDQSEAYQTLQKLVTKGKATPSTTRLFIVNSGGIVAS